MSVIFLAALIGIMPRDVLAANCRLRYLISKCDKGLEVQRKRNSFPLFLSL